MFRGGPVDSYNTGITSGLDDSGYADGGRVSAKIGGFFSGLFNRGKTTIPGVQNNPPLSGFALKQNTPTSTSLPPIDYLDLIGVGDFAKAARPYLANPAIGIPALGYGAYEIGRLPGRLTDSGYEIAGGEEEKFIKDFGGEILGKETSTGEAITGYYLTKNQKRAQDLLKRGEPGDKEMAEKLIKSSTPQKPEKQPESELDKLKKFYEDQILSEKNKYESQLAGLKTTPLTEEEDIIKQTQLYQKLLGGDEAKSQAVYDALLAASPAFFKGRNLREAVPEVLTAINKSGAFDKPRDIKQAAAQLSIQRAMLKDKAVAEERSRLAIYGAKNQETLSEVVKNTPGSFIAGPLPKGAETNPNLLRPGGIYSVGDQKFYAVPGDVVDASGKKKSGVVSLQKL
jgi:hypothetical protein